MNLGHQPKVGLNGPPAKTIDIQVTSVLQTTVGKMIFGKWDERSAPIRTEPVRSSPPPSAPAASGVASSGISSSGVTNGPSVTKSHPILADRPVE